MAHNTVSTPAPADGALSAATGHSGRRPGAAEEMAAWQAAEDEKAEALADLEQRCRRAWEIACEAHDAGDADKARRAMERFFQRLEQVLYLRDRPPDAWCLMCSTAPLDEPDSAQAIWTEAVCMDHFAEWAVVRAKERTRDLYGDWERGATG